MGGDNRKVSAALGVRGQQGGGMNQQKGIAMNQNISVSETLNKAADLIEKRGWRPFGGWPDTDEYIGHLCLEGGIMAALGLTVNDGGIPEMWKCGAYIAVSDYLGCDLTLNDDHIPADPLWRWNDQRGRTAAEVIEVLRAIAVIEEARETEAAAVSA